MSFTKTSQKLKPAIWGKHYWFFLHTVAYNYPLHANAVTKRKYYDLIINFPLFIPDEKMGNRFAELLDKYPVTPYLDNRDSFIRWVWFIHNKINRLLEKDEITIYESMDKYMAEYDILQTPKWWWLGNWKITKQHVVFFILLFALFLFIINQNRM